ncbi:MAG: DMT family transporter [Acidobacteria bacterium]|nr:DMT family transporter [Acidobacteriota bacterium]
MLLCLVWGSTWLFIKVGYGGLGPFNVAAVRFFVASAACAAAAGVVTKRHAHRLHPAALNAPAMLVGAVALLVASLLAGDGFALPRDGATWWAVTYLALAGSVLTFLVYFTLLKTWSVTSLSFISVFTPAVALFLGFAFLDERPTVLTAVGAVLILTGVALALTRGPAALRHAQGTPSVVEG